MVRNDARLWAAAGALTALVAAAPSVSSAQTPRPSERCRPCDSAARADQWRGPALEVARLQHDILQLRLKRLEAERTNDGEHADAVMREVDPQIRRLTQELARAQAELNAQVKTRTTRALEAVADGQTQTAMASIGRLQPSGYLGVSYSGDPRWWYEKDKGLVVYHAKDPVIVSVEPGSPAEKGGLEKGDTIIAYNSQVVRDHNIAIGQMLRPGERVTVRVRRDGRTRDVPIVVGRRPDGDAPFLMLPGSGSSNSMAMPAMPPMPPMPPMPSMSPMPPAPATGDGWTATWTFPGAGSSLVIAGARLDRLTSDWRDILGVDVGVVVLGVAAGTPAQDAGLRAGDVIVRADDQAVGTPQALQRAVSRAGDRSVTLQLVRKSKTRTVVLKW